MIGSFRTLLIVFFLFFSISATSGQSFPDKIFPHWTSYTNSNYVKDLILDGGTLWIAGGGVTKLDMDKGERMKYLKEHGLASNDALKMTLLNNTLWIGTANGITYHDLEKKTWKSFYKTDGLPDDAVTAITSDPINQYIWIGTWEGYLYGHNTITNKWDFVPIENKNLDRMISALAMDPNRNTLWIGTWGEGLYSYSIGSKLLAKQKLTEDHSIDYVTALFSEDEKLWVGTVEKGLFVIDLGAVPIKSERIKNPSIPMITNIKAIPGRNQILITTMGKGLMIYDKEIKIWQSITIKNRLPTDRLSSSAYDGRYVFLGSDGEGVIQFDMRDGAVKQHKILNEISHNRVSAIASDIKNSRIWVGTEGNGASSLEVLSGEWRTFNVSNKVLASDVVNSISIDSVHRTVWFGTDEGLVRYEPNCETYVRYGPQEGLSNHLVYASDFDHRKRLWVAFFYGSPAVYDPQKDIFKVIEKIPGVVCHALSIDRRGSRVWMATDWGILGYNLRTKKIERYWPNIEFRSIYFNQEKKEIWAGSWEKGLFYLNLRNGKRRKIKELKDLSVLDIQNDPWSKIIWFATDEGVFFFDQKKQNWEHLDVTKGLGLNFVLSIGILPDSIWFGTWGGGLSRFSK